MKIRGKIFFSVMTTALLFFLSVFIYLGWNYRKKSIDDAFKLADSFAQQSALKTKGTLDNDITTVRTMAVVFQEFLKQDKKTLGDKYPAMLKSVLESNPRFLSVWVSFELWAIEKNYIKPFGRQRIQMVKTPEGEIQRLVDTVNINGEDIKSLYYKIKINKNSEFALNPYYYKYKSESFSDSILETSLVVKVFNNNKFAALAAVDVALPELQAITRTELPFDSSIIFLVANNGAFISHQKEEYTGLDIGKYFDKRYSKINIPENIRNGNQFSFNNLDDDGEISGYTTFAPIKIGNSNEPWALGITVPTESITKNARTNFINTTIVGVLGFILLTVVIFFISANIISPLNDSIRILQELETGNLNIEHELPEKRSDELGTMAQSLSKLIISLNSTAEFAQKIGKGNLNVEYNAISENDVLGNALLEMRNNLQKAEKDREERVSENQKISWAQTGMSEFGEILQQNVDNPELLADNVTKKLIKYIGAAQGGLFIYNSETKLLELRSAYAYDKKKKLQTTFEPGEGLVGRCAREKQTIYLTDIPEGYTFISSGLGEDNPKVLILVPLIHESMVVGVLEIASFNPIEKYKLDFVESLGQRIATTFTNLRISVETNELIREFHTQSVELDKFKHKAEDLIIKNLKTEAELMKSESINKNINEAVGYVLAILYYDLDGNLLEMNRKAENLFGKTETLKGKTQIEIFPELKDNLQWYSLFWNDLRTGKMRRKEFHFKNETTDIWLFETYTPFYNKEGELEKIMCTGVDISKQKALEQKI